MSASPCDHRGGKGLKAKVGGREILAGNRKLMEEAGYPIEDVEEVLHKLEDEAKTAVIVAIDGKIVGVMGIADTIKENAREAIEELHRMGKKVGMITGDNRRTANAIAKQLKIDYVLAEVLPGGTRPARSGSSRRGGERSSSSSATA